MLKKILAKAINHYDKIDYICMINGSGIVEYSVIYSSKAKEYINEDITGMHILSVYPELSLLESSMLKSLSTAKEIYNIYQELTDWKGRVHYLKSADFPILQNNKVFGVIEVSKIITKKEYENFKQGLVSLEYNNISSLDKIITENYDLINLKEKVKKVAYTDSSVLIEGETGTGKDMIAQALHSEGHRKHMPFIAQNCAAIPSNLLESIFFGTVKGAYTGAEDRKGLFEIANGGTLFLDELNSMEMNLQVKILKALEEGYIRRLGSTTNTYINVRIVSAMNIKPEIALKQGLIREDLFYRLSVVRMKVPSLVERKEDILLLANHFIKEYNKLMNKNVRSISEMVETIFLNHKWSGNVRELKNIIESIFNLIEGDTITIKDIPAYLYQEIEIPINKDFIFKRIDTDTEIIFQKSLPEKLNDYEKILIEKALKYSDSMAKAAKILKITPQALQYKLKKYNLNDKT